MEFLTEVEEGENSTQELKAAHAETIQELQKTRKLLTMESKISHDYKVESFSCTNTHSSAHAHHQRAVLKALPDTGTFEGSLNAAQNILYLCF